jgi:hypothetical protein
MSSSVDLDESVGGQVCRLLKETKRLETFHLSSFDIEEEGAALMVEGVCENKTVQELVFQDCVIPLNLCTVLLESCVVNQTVKKFDIFDRYMLHDSAEDNRFFLSYYETSLSSQHIARKLSLADSGD